LIKLLLTLLYPLVTAGEHDRGVRVSKVSACPLEIVELVRTGRTATAASLVQAIPNRHEGGVIEIFESYAEGRAALAGFDYARSPARLGQRV
jgi:hypothetical protein